MEVEYIYQRSSSCIFMCSSCNCDNASLPFNNLLSQYSIIATVIHNKATTIQVDSLFTIVVIILKVCFRENHKWVGCIGFVNEIKKVKDKDGNDTSVIMTTTYGKDLKVTVDSSDQKLTNQVVVKTDGSRVTITDVASRLLLENSRLFW